MKAVLFKYSADRFTAEDGVTAGGKAFFQDILVQGNSHIIFKCMGDVEFTHIKLLGKLIQ